MKWFRLAAAQGEPKSQIYLAKHILSDKAHLTEELIQEGIEFLTQSADSGYMKAQIHLATVWGEGKYNLKPDLNKCFKYFYKAAQEGNPIAQGSVGEMLIKGKGTSKNVEEGTKIRSISSSKWCNSSYSQFSLYV